LTDNIDMTLWVGSNRLPISFLTAHPWWQRPLPVWVFKASVPFSLGCENFVLSLVLLFVYAVELVFKLDFVHGLNYLFSQVTLRRLVDNFPCVQLLVIHSVVESRTLIRVCFVLRMGESSFPPLLFGVQLDPRLNTLRSRTYRTTKVFGFIASLLLQPFIIVPVCSFFKFLENIRSWFEVGLL
jgi:hypothetical protein